MRWDATGEVATQLSLDMGRDRTVGFLGAGDKRLDLRVQHGVQLVRPCLAREIRGSRGGRDGGGEHATAPSKNPSAR